MPMNQFVSVPHNLTWYKLTLDELVLQLSCQPELKTKEL